MAKLNQIKENNDGLFNPSKVQITMLQMKSSLTKPTYVHKAFTVYNY